MKKKIVFLVALISSLLFINTASKAQLTNGPLFGANFANFSGDDAKDNSMRISFHIGYEVNIPATDNISIHPQLLFSSKGAKFDDGTDKIPYNLNYIEVPIWGRYNLENGLHFDFGPYIGFLMGVTVDGESEYQNGNATHKFKDDYKSTDVGIGFGLGYEFKTPLGIAVNYNLGLSNIADYEGGDLKNSLIKISLSYTLGK
ncbi:MAG TPA: porin family protein [Bacteroidia bacterium]|nr:porin family protein [Bacteroidia bacterium]